MFIIALIFGAIGIIVAILAVLLCSLAPSCDGAGLGFLMVGGMISFICLILTVIFLSIGVSGYRVDLQSPVIIEQQK